MHGAWVQFMLGLGDWVIRTVWVVCGGGFWEGAAGFWDLKGIGFVVLLSGILVHCGLIG